MEISVVMTTYNGEKFLKDQLDSIRHQTLQPDEVLIVDDVSTDHTPQLILEYIERYNLVNWHFEINHQNLGWRKNFWQALKKANGDVIFISDQDDIWHPRKMELMFKVLDQDKSIQLLASHYSEFIDSGSVKFTQLPNFNRQLIKPIPADQHFIHVRLPGCTYAVTKNLVHQADTVWSVDQPHDGTLWRYGILTDHAYELLLPLVKWRTHAGSADYGKSHGFQSLINFKETGKIAYQVRIKLIQEHIHFLQHCLLDERLNPHRILIDDYLKFEQKRAETLNQKLWWSGMYLQIRKNSYYESWFNSLGDLYIILWRKFLKF